MNETEADPYAMCTIEELRALVADGVIINQGLWLTIIDGLERQLKFVRENRSPLAEGERSRLLTFARGFLYTLTGHQERLLFSMREVPQTVLLQYFGFDSVDEMIAAEAEETARLQRT